MNRQTVVALGISWFSAVLATLALTVILLEGSRPLPSFSPAGPSLRRPSSGPPVVRLRGTPAGQTVPSPDSRTPELPNSRTAELLNSRILEPPDSLTAGRPNGPPGAPVVWVMDDMGRDVETAEVVLRWPVFVSIAVLPDGAVAGWSARRACRQGRDVLIHLPMASVRPEVDPGPMAVSAHTADAEVRRILTQAHRLVPCAMGLNQHMGSQASQEVRTMTQVVRAGWSLGLRFFIDSRTTARSHLCDAAERLGRPCLRRTLFFDADASPEELPARWREVVARARRSAQPVVVLAHPYPATLAFLDRLFRTDAWRAVEWRRPSEVLGTFDPVDPGDGR